MPAKRTQLARSRLPDPCSSQEIHRFLEPIVSRCVRSMATTLPVVIPSFSPSTMSQPDLINHPPHYTMGKYEVWEVIEDWNLDYHLGNIVKYVARSPHKGN